MNSSNFGGHLSFQIQTGPVNGRFSISFPSFDMNLIEIYFIAIIYIKHCVYFDLYKCWNSDEGESRKRSIYLVFALLMI